MIKTASISFHAPSVAPALGKYNRTAAGIEVSAYAAFHSGEFERQRSIGTDLGRGIGWQQLRAIGRPQNIEPHRHWRPDPQRILAVVVIGAFGERMDENVEALMVQHQPRHDFLKFFGLKDDVEL
jgi:hypothetical protein